MSYCELGVGWVGGLGELDVTQGFDHEETTFLAVLGGWVGG